MGSADAVSVEGQLTFYDLYRWLVRVNLGRFGWYYAAFTLFMVAVMSFSHTPRWWAPEHYWPVPAFAIGAFVIPYFSARGLVKSQKSILQNTRYTFSEQGIEANSLSVSSRMDWSNVYQAVETKTSILIYYSKYGVWIIPKRYIADEPTLSTIRQMIRHHVGGKVLLLK